MAARLGKAQRADNLDAGGLAGLLGGQTDTLARQQPEAMGFLGQLLDADNDATSTSAILRRRG